MLNFIESIAKATLELPPRRTLVIFPTQRACQEYKKEYAKQKAKAGWLPTVLPIRDLLGKLNTPFLLDDLSLLLKLYAIHVKFFGEEEFGSFMSFGQQIIDDFNEIDRQLINADQLFEEIYDLRTLDERFEPGAEEAEYIKAFWSEFIGTTHTPLQHSFLKYWKQLPLLYKEFKTVLHKENQGYEGLAWRFVVETMSQQNFFDEFDHIAFCGFYALNKSEEKVMMHLQKAGKLLLFVDADEYYTQPKYHEAGMFFRRGLLADNSLSWKHNLFSTPKESYHVKGCNGGYALTCELAQDIHRLVSSNADLVKLNGLVVVLADESLMFSLYQQCQRLGVNLNPSMGFPLKYHPAFKVLSAIKQFRKLRTEDVNELVKYRQLEELYQEPLIHRFFARDKSPLTSVGTEELQTEDTNFFSLMLHSVDPSIETDKKNIRSLLTHFKFSEDEWIYPLHHHLLQYIDQVFAILQSHEMELSNENWWELFIDELGLARIPYSVADGIPVMGFLETRILDFDHVYIAPLNEGSLPSSTPSKSLIPYSLRKAYHLPCMEEQDAVTAYHFYRLLQRAKHIRFYYTTNLSDQGAGEKSRYLYQLHHELLENCPPKSIVYEQQDSVVNPSVVEPIIVNKSEEIITKLKEKFTVEFSDPQKFAGLSASALNSYIACSLRFYFDQLAGIRPDDEVEGLSAGHFGNVLHKAMEIAYKKQEVITKEYIGTLLTQVDAIVEQAIKLAYGKPVQTGHDFLMKKVLIALVTKIFEYDLECAPIELKGLEQNLRWAISIPGQGEVWLKGIIDRLDFFEDHLRILDYKTGRDTIKKVDDFSTLFQESELKLNVQLLFYTLLVRKAFDKGAHKLKAGIFKLRSFEDGIDWLNEGDRISDELLNDFQEELIQKITELFNPEVPFVQTTDLKQCSFCDYKGLCSRQAT